MQSSRRRLALEWKPELWVALAFALLILPVRWVIAWVLASLFHELCHYAAIRLCGGRIFGLNMGLNGASMEMECLSPGKEFLCAVAGPAGSLLLLLLAKWFPRLALCALFQAAYNLLPVFPLDGGRAARSAFRRLLPPPWAERAEQWVKFGTLLVLACFGAYGSIVLSLGPIPILSVVILTLKTMKIKIPCKPDRERVQ